VSIDRNLIDQLFDDGILTALYKAGLISDKIFTYRNIYLFVDARMKTTGISQEKAALEAQVKFNLSRKTVYKAIYTFK
jgi:hypothetical protein